jgi:hypothetical protein
MIDKLRATTQTRKIITTINPWTNTKYNERLNDDHFWLQKKQNSLKITTLNPIYTFNKKQFLLCQLGIPKELKHIPFQSLQINAASPMKIKVKSNKLLFCINKLVNTKYNRFFINNSQSGVALKIQSWEEEIKPLYKEAVIVRITLIDYRNFEEQYDEKEEYGEWNLCYWVRFTIKVAHKFYVRKSLGHCGSEYSRITEELNQKWIFYRKNYFKGVRGIVKGKISWNKIEKEVYDRENEQEEDIIDDEQPFEMKMDQRDWEALQAHICHCETKLQYRILECGPLSQRFITASCPAFRYWGQTVKLASQQVAFVDVGEKAH